MLGDLVGGYVGWWDVWVGWRDAMWVTQMLAGLVGLWVG